MRSIASTNISLRDLRAFLHVAEYSSFTRASERLHMTQAGLSALIRNLESQLDCRLFARTTRSVTLTAAGEKLRPLALRTIEDFASLATEMSSASDAADRLLRIGATPVVCAQLLPQVTWEFRRRRPDVTVQIADIARDQIAPQLRSGDIDIGLTTDLAAGGDLKAQRIFATHLLCITRAPAGARSWSEGQAVGRLRWADLPDQPLVSLPPDDPLQRRVDSHLQGGGGSRRMQIVVGHMETQIAMAAGGLGMAIIPSLALPACQRYGVEVKLLVEPMATMDFCCLRKGERPLTPVMNAYYDTLVDVLQASFGKLVA